MIAFSSKYRSKQVEILDNLELKGSEMEAMLVDLKTVNKLLGGHKVTLSGIETLLQSIPKDKLVTIVDIGCGDGDMLRKIADFSKKKKYSLSLIGIDANPHILKKAKDRSKAYPEITFKHHNILDEHAVSHFDIALCTLFLHHFTQEEGQLILEKLCQDAKVGVVVNDLQRNRLAFWLFRVFSSIFIKTAIAKHDGLVSIARAFKRNELEIIAASCRSVQYTLKKKWAFRWQLVVKKNK